MQVSDAILQCRDSSAETKFREGSMQNSTAVAECRGASGKKVKCETSVQNAECRLSRGSENEAENTEFDFRIRMQERSLRGVYVSMQDSNAISRLNCPSLHKV